MTEPGTLAGLIADLENYHFLSDDEDSGEAGFCGICGERWPCGTDQIVRKHKRAQYEIIEIGRSEAVVNLINRRNVQSPYTHIQKFHGPVSDAEAWIDKQVNG